MGGKLATGCGRKKQGVLTPFRTALGMRGKSGDAKSESGQLMAGIRLICPYRRI